jgi:type I restriction enzyme S subunit
MNRIQQLIQQLCPEGVEFKRMGDIGEFVRGNGLQKKDFTESGVGCIHYGQIHTFYGTYTNTTKSFVSETLAKKLKKASKNDLVMATVSEDAEGVCKTVAWLGNHDICVSGDTLIFKQKENPKFLSYYLQTQMFIDYKKRNASGTKVIRVQTDKLKKFPIPIPPLPIQHEIVNILDKFTQLEAELEEVLSAELEARKKQYEYYRNQLLCFEGKEVEWKMLGEVGEFVRGKRFVKNDIVSEGVPCIHYGELYTHYKIWAKEAKSYLEPDLAAKLRTASTGDVVIVSAGETIEDIGNGVAWLGESDVVIHDACFAYTHSMNPKYVSYYLQTNLFRSQIKSSISSGKISSINASGLSKAKIPIPPMDEQERIVEILDKFDTLLNDISVGLPAEIEARRKQYEYYRGQLLDFKNISNG